METNQNNLEIGAKTLVEKYLAKGESVLKDFKIGKYRYFFTSTRLIKFEMDKSIVRHEERFEDVPYQNIDYLKFSYLGPIGIWLIGLFLIVASVICAALLHGLILLLCIPSALFFLDFVYFKAILSLQLKGRETFEIGGVFTRNKKEEIMSLITGEALGAIRTFLVQNRGESRSEENNSP